MLDARDLAGEDLVEGVAQRHRDRQQRVNREKGGPRAYHYQRARQAHHDRNDPRHVDALVQHRHGQDRDKHREHEADGRRLGQGEHGERREIQQGGCAEHQAAHNLRLGTGSPDPPQLATRHHEGRQHDEVYGVPRPDHASDRIALRKVLGDRVHHREARNRDQHQQDAAQRVVR